MPAQAPKLYSPRPRPLAPGAKGPTLHTGKPTLSEAGRASVSLAGSAHTNGELCDTKAVLASQVAILQVLFRSLVCKAEEAGTYLEAAEAYMRLALRAQAQLLATIELLDACEGRASE